jgi:uncharacterized protein involved in exopolysaccharide biosynthesis
MADMETKAGDTEHASSSERSILLEVLTIMRKWRAFIIVTVLLVTIASVVVSLLLPKWYASRTVILPPRSRSLLAGSTSISALQRELPALRSLTGGVGSEEVYRYLAILKSRAAMERVVGKFNLIAVYEIEDSSVAKAAEALEENVSYKLGEEGTISITVLDRDPQRAAAMANYFIEVLNDIATDLSIQEAKNSRDFLEQRVHQNEEELKTAEERYKKFQKEYGYLAMPQVEFLRVYRDLAVQQKIYEFLLPLYEQARYEEKRDAARAVVLDVAQVPEEPARPKKRLIVSIFFLLSLISSASVAIFVERIRSLSSSRG